MTRKFALTTLTACVLQIGLLPVGVAQDWPADSWPQWGGPNRNHKSNASGLLKQWPEGGPPVAWKFTDAGIGYSSFSVLDGKFYTLGLIGGKNYAICLDAGSGEQLWRTPISDEVPSESYLQGWGAGPRSTPTISGDRLIVLGDGGTLCSLDRMTGEPHWKVNLVSDFGGQIPKWGYSASPLIDGDRVVVCPGKEQFLVALDIETGKQVLSSSGYNETAHYVSVVKHTVGGIDMYVTAAQSGLVGFSAETGRALWTNGSSGNATATIPTPILKDNLVYHTSDYGTGCVLVELSATDGRVRAREVYRNKNMQNHHGGVILLGDNLFGLKKGGGWVCQDLMTGEVNWNKRLSGDGSASVAYADGRIYVFGESTGTCYLVEPSAEKWIEHGKVSLPEQTGIDRGRGKIWAHPVIAEGKLFLRDMDLIYAFDIRG